MDSNVAKYVTQQVMTATPAKLVFMMYDRTITSLREAITAIENDDIEGRWKANNRAMEILQHMWSTLDLEYGGEIAEKLNQLLPYLLLRLPEIDLRNDPQPARDAIRLLEPLRDSWREIAMKGPNADSAGAGQVASPVSTTDGDGATLRTSLSA